MSERQHSDIQRELTDLEATGRVSARDQRQIHRTFGFESIERDAVPSTSVPADVATSLDDAWSRLKRTISPD